MNRNNFLPHLAIALVLIFVAAFAGQLRKWQKDWKVVTLGGRILRAETAAITICALLEHRFGDLK